MPLSEQESQQAASEGRVVIDSTSLYQALGGDWRTLRFPVPTRLASAGEVATEVEIELRVNFELPPSVKGDDPRSLGAKIAKIAFEPGV